MGEVVEISTARTVGGVLGKFADVVTDRYTEAFPDAKALRLDDLNSEDLNALVEMTKRARGEVESMENELRERWDRRFKVQADAPVLSAREHQVLGRVAAGMGQREIAEDLFISYETVHDHLDKI